MSKIDEKLGDVIEKLTKLAETHAASAMDLAIAKTRVDGLSEIVGGAILLVAVLSTLFLLRRIWRTLIKIEKEEPAGGFFVGFVAPVCSLPWIFATGCAADNLLSVWAWVAVLEPKLALAKQIMRAAGL